MVCPKCKGEVQRGAPRCPHCGVKFAYKPKPPAPPPPKPEPDLVLSVDPPPAPTPARPARRSVPMAAPVARPHRAGRVLTSHSPATFGGIGLGVLLLIGFGIRTCVRMSREVASGTEWQGVEDKEVTIVAGDSDGGTVESDIVGTYHFEVTVREGRVGIGVLPLTRKEASLEDVNRLSSVLKDVPAGRTEIITAPVKRGSYLWIVQNRSEEKPARVHIVFKGREK